MARRLRRRRHFRRGRQVGIIPDKLKEREEGRGGLECDIHKPPREREREKDAINPTGAPRPPAALRPIPHCVCSPPAFSSYTLMPFSPLLFCAAQISVKGSRWLCMCCEKIRGTCHSITTDFIVDEIYSIMPVSH